MYGRIIFRHVLCVALLLAATSCSDDGGGPSQPPAPIPRIAGIWSGIFSSDNGDSVVIFDLAQTGGNISGVVSVGAIVWSLEGEVNAQGFFQWRTRGATCGSFNGDAILTTATHLQGDAQLDRFFCPEGQRLQGDLDLDRETAR